MQLPDFDPSMLEHELIRLWNSHSKTPISRDLLKLAHEHIRSALVAIYHGLDVTPCPSLPEMPPELLRALNESARAMAIEAAKRPPPSLPTLPPSPHWSLSPYLRARLITPRQLRLMHRLRAEKLPFPYPGRASIFDLKSAWMTRTWWVVVAALAVYTWRKWPNPADVYKIGLPPDDIYSLPIYETFETQTLPQYFYVGKNADIGISQTFPHSGDSSLRMHTWGWEPDEYATITCRWTAPAPIMQKLTLFLHFRPVKWNTTVTIFVRLLLPSRYQTIHASIAMNWVPGTGWEASLLTGNRWQTFRPTFGWKIREWSLIRLDIDLPTGFYTRAFLHSADLLNAPLLCGRGPGSTQPLLSLTTSFSCTTEKSTEFQLDDVMLFNYGELLPGYTAEELIDPVLYILKQLPTPTRRP